MSCYKPLWITRSGQSGRLWLSLLLGLVVAGAVGTAQAQMTSRHRPEAVRFSGRLQVLSGAALALPDDAQGDLHLAAYVPLDIELALRISGLFSMGLGAVLYDAPFSVSTCPDSQRPIEASRAHGLAALGAVRLDFRNSRDGSWWSPFVALRGGIVGQNGVLDGPACSERFVLAPYLGPRVGTDLWLGKAAATFALGYDRLPRASAVSLQVGLTVWLF